MEQKLVVYHGSNKIIEKPIFGAGNPRNDYGFIDCLYRMAVSLGYKIVFSYIKNYVASNLGLMDRALVIEVKK